MEHRQTDPYQMPQYAAYEQRLHNVLIKLVSLSRVYSFISVNNFLVMSGCFLGLTSTKQEIKCLLFVLMLYLPVNKFSVM